jgi:CNT family concentrative nucleoside transporter
VQSVIDYANVGIQFCLALGERKPGSIIVAFRRGDRVLCSADGDAVLPRDHAAGHQVHEGGLHKLLRRARIESMSAVADIFVGHTERLGRAPVPADSHKVELFAIMTAGSPIAGAVMAGYAAMGIDLKY